jgi:hypothetical protein
MNIIRMIKSSKIKWSGHVAYMRKIRNAYRILVGNPDGTRPIRRQVDIYIDFREKLLRVCAESPGLKQEPVLQLL